MFDIMQLEFRVACVGIYGGIAMEEKEKYKEEIKEIIDSIEDEQILEYFYYFITEKMKKAV